MTPLICLDESMLADILRSYCNLTDLAQLDSAVCRKSDRSVLLRMFRRFSYLQAELPQGFYIEATHWLWRRGISCDELRVDALKKLFDIDNEICSKVVNPQSVDTVEFTTSYKLQNSSEEEFNTCLFALLEHCTSVRSVTGINASQFQRVVSVCAAHLREADINLDFDTVAFMTIAPLFKELHLHRLVINDLCKYRTEEAVQDNIVEALCIQILASQPELKVFALPNVDGRGVLLPCFSMHQERNRHILRSVAVHCPNIEVLDVLTAFGSLELAEFVTKNFKYFQDFWVRMGGMDVAMSGQRGGATYLMQHCPTYCPKRGILIMEIDDECLALMEGHVCGVDHFELSHIDEKVIKLMRSCPHTKHVTSCSRGYRSVETMVALLKLLPCLQHLSVHDAKMTDLSDVFQQFSATPLPLHSLVFTKYKQETCAWQTEHITAVVRGCDSSTLRDVRLASSCQVHDWDGWMALGTALGDLFPYVTFRIELLFVLPEEEKQDGSVKLHINVTGPLQRAKLSVSNVGASFASVANALINVRVEELEFTTTHVSSESALITFLEQHPEVWHVRVVPWIESKEKDEDAPVVRILVTHCAAFQPRAERQKTGARRGVLRRNPYCTISQETQQRLVKECILPMLGIQTVC